MAYTDPRLVDGVFPEPVLKELKHRYFAWMQSGWKSNGKKEYDHGHNQHYALRNAKHIEVDLTDTPNFEQDHPGIADAFDIIQQIIGPRGLIRCYAKSYHYGQDAYAHSDMQDSKFVTKDGKTISQEDEPIEGFETIIVYMSKDWKIDYYGATILYTDEGEIDASCLPKYNRMFIFDSSQLHASSPLSRLCPINKDIMVFNTMPIWQKDDGFKYLMDHTKDYPHTGRSFSEHLWNVYQYLEHNLRASPAACKAGLWHSAYGTSAYKQNKGDPNFTRDIVRGFIGEEAEDLVHQFCSFKSPRTPKILESGNKDLMMIEFANLVDQNPDGKYNDSIMKLQSGWNDITGAPLEELIEDEARRDTE